MAIFLMACHTGRKIQSSSTKNSKHSTSLQQQITYWLGTPYLYGGSTKKGVDCSGLVCAIYQKVYQVKLPRTSAEQFFTAAPISEKEVREGDLVFFRIGGSHVSHVGIYLKDHQFLHASSSKGVIMSSLLESYYKKHLAGYGRITKP